MYLFVHYYVLESKCQSKKKKITLKKKALE